MNVRNEKIYSFLISLFMLIAANAQTKPSLPAGEYYLRGERETASGFKLNADSSFEFFFSYGALDRYGKGRWQTRNDTVIFNSGPKSAQDFKLLSATKGTAAKISVRLKEGNAALLPHFYCRIKGGGKEQEGMTDKNGFVSFKPQVVETIKIFFEFCPEKLSVFPVTAKGLHNFVFAPEPWLMDVFFQNFKLAFAPDGLRGGHPLLDKASFFYEKSNYKE